MKGARLMVGGVILWGVAVGTRQQVLAQQNGGLIHSTTPANNVFANGRRQRLSPQPGRPPAFPVYATSTASAEKAKAWGPGMNWHFTRAVHVAVNYERTTFKGG